MVDIIWLMSYEICWYPFTMVVNVVIVCLCVCVFSRAVSLDVPSNIPHLMLSPCLVCLSPHVSVCLSPYVSIYAGLSFDRCPPRLAMGSARYADVLL